MPVIQHTVAATQTGNRQDASEPSLTQRTLHGFLWLFSQTVATRLVNFAGQLVLAWLLEPSAFGLIGLVYAIQAFASLVLRNGVEQILVARQSDYERLANAAFWFSLATGVAAAFFMAGAAPFVAQMFGHPELTALILIMAAAAPFDALRAVPTARLRIDLRFGASAVVNTAAMAAQMTLTVILAVLGFGAFSFILPLLVVAPATALALYWLTRPPLRSNPQLDLWRSLLGLSGLLLLTSMFGQIMWQGDYLILGAFYGVEIVGIYFLAYSLSVQGVMLLTNNLGGVLFPTLTRLQHEPQRQRAAFIRAARIMTLVAMPASIALAVAADPLIRLLFHEKWLPVIPVLQVLAVGMALRMLMPLTAALLKACGQFGLLLSVTIVQAAIFLALAFISVKFGLWYFAVAVSASFIVGPLIAMCTALGCTQQTFREMLHILAVPLLASLLGAVIAIPLVVSSPKTLVWQASILVLIFFIFAVAVLSITNRFTPALWWELASMKRQFFTTSSLDVPTST